MRVLLVAHRFLPEHVAGTEVYTAALARGLAGRGHAVEIAAGDPSGASGTRAWEGLRVHMLPWGVGGQGVVQTFMAGFGSPGVERRFEQICAAFRPEIVHIQHLMGLSPRLPEIARRAGARVVITLHDFWFVCSNTWLYRWDGTLCAGPGWGYHCGGCALQRLGRPANPALMAAASPVFAARTASVGRALKAADRLIAPSQASAREYIRLGAPAERLSVVPDAVPHAVAPVPAEKQFGRPPTFVYLGSLIPVKGAHVAVEAFNGLRETQARLLVYGDPAADPTYTNELRRLARHPGIEFKGRVDNARVPGVLSEADVLLLPSLWYETYSIAVDEAFGAGVPVLVSEQTAAAERVVPGQNGLTAPAGDVAAWRARMQQLASEPELLARLRRGVRPPPPMEAHLDQIESVYRALRAGPGQGDA